jgi:hypothetical protein
MKTINELWDELTNHPDYVAGNIWKLSDVSCAIESEIQSYLEEEFEIDDIGVERLESLSKEFVKLNKKELNEIIYNFESFFYKRSMWEVDISEMEMPNLELFKTIEN